MSKKVTVESRLGSLLIDFYHQQRRNAYTYVEDEELVQQVIDLIGSTAEGIRKIIGEGGKPFVEAATLGSGTSSSEAANPQIRCTDSKRNALVRDSEDTHTLLPCPFCGGDAKLCSIGTGSPHYGHYHKVLCQGCLTASGAYWSGEQSAIDAWNTRTELVSGECKLEPLSALDVTSNMLGQTEWGACSECGCAVPMEARFCNECGRKVAR